MSKNYSVYRLFLSTKYSVYRLFLLQLTLLLGSGFLSPQQRRASPSPPTTRRYVFGGWGLSNKKGAAAAKGFVRSFEIGDVNKEELVDWLQAWGKRAEVDNSLMGDEFVFPFSTSATEDGVAVTFKYIEAGEIVPVGVVDFTVKTVEGSSDGSIDIVRRDGVEKAFLGEVVVISDMIQSLQNETPEAPPESLESWGASAEEAARDAKPSEASPSEVKKSTDTRYTAPWKVFFDDLGGK